MPNATKIGPWKKKKELPNSRGVRVALTCVDESHVSVTCTPTVLVTGAASVTAAAAAESSSPLYAANSRSIARVSPAARAASRPAANAYLKSTASELMDEALEKESN
jgi:hypothetical protein